MRGEGVGKYEGMAVFVPDSVPGDELEVRLVEMKRNFARGAVVKVLKPSPPGDYFLVMNAYSGGPCEVSLVDITIVQGLGFTTDLQIPGIAGKADIDPNPVAANSVYNFNLTWNFAGNDIGIHRPGPRAWQDATYLGVLYVGPKDNPLAFLIPVTLTLDRERPPRINNIKPLADKAINDFYPQIGADFTTDTPDDPVPVDPNSVKLFLDGVSITGATTSKTGVIYQPDKTKAGDALKSGLHNVKIIVADLAGNTNSTEWNFTISRTVPSLTVDNPAGLITYTNLANYTISGNTSVSGIDVYVNNVRQNLTDGKFSTAVPLADNSLSGATDVIIAAWDSAGNANYANRTIIRDITAPEYTLTLETSAAGLKNNKSYTNNATLTVLGNIDTNTEYNSTWDIHNSFMNVTGDGKFTGIDAQADGSFAGAVNLTDGENALAFNAVDSAGNVGKQQRTVVLDTAKPTLEITTSNSASSDTIKIEGTAKDNTGIEIVTINGKEADYNAADGKFSGEVTLAQKGKDNLVLIVAMDYAGNIQAKEFIVQSGNIMPLVIGLVVVVLVVIVAIAFYVLFFKKKGPAAPARKADEKPGEKKDEKALEKGAEAPKLEPAKTEPAPPPKPELPADKPAAAPPTAGGAQSGGQTPTSPATPPPAAGGTVGTPAKPDTPAKALSDDEWK